jgi:hypothetical protein
VVIEVGGRRVCELYISPDACPRQGVLGIGMRVWGSPTNLGKLIAETPRGRVRW